MIHFDKFFTNNYLRGCILLTTLIISGIFLNFLIGFPINRIPAFPFNLYILIVLTLSQISVFYRFRKFKLIDWCSKPSFLFVAFSGFFICRTYQILVNQNIIIIDAKLLPDLTIFTTGWVDLFLRIFLITCLCFSLLNRLYPLKGKYFGSIFFHLGIWLVIVALWVGLPDKQKISINLFENGEKCNFGISKNDKIIEIPFYVQLIDFKINRYKYPILSKEYWAKKYFTGIRKLPDMSSLLVISYDSIRNDTVLLSLYKPINREGWNLYPIGYDENKGQLSTFCIIQAEKNPWGKISISGYIFIFCGLILIFIYRKPKSRHPSFLPEHYK